MNRTALLVALTLASTTATALQPGDIALTAFNADEDGFAIVALRDLAPFTSVHFSDNEWSGGAPGSGAFNTGENTFAWISGSAPIAAGTVVRFSAIDQAARAASIGAFGLTQSGSPGFSATGDTIFAFHADGAGAPTRFLAALSSENFAGSALAGTGLALGVNAIAITASTDFGQYTGPRTGLSTFGGYGALLHDPRNWTLHLTGDFADFAPNMTGFEIAPVPEPETYALLLTGLGLIGFRLRQTRLRQAPLARIACPR